MRGPGVLLLRLIFNWIFPSFPSVKRPYIFVSICPGVFSALPMVTTMRNRIISKKVAKEEARRDLGKK